MPSKEMFKKVCSMMKRENGATAIEMQYKYNLSYDDVINYILMAKKIYTIAKTGRKLKIVCYTTQTTQTTSKKQNIYKGLIKS